MKKLTLFLVILTFLAVGFVTWYIKGLNYVVTLDEKASEAWSQVETQLQRRYDLIPNLVNTVKGYATHEKELFTKITALRSQWSQATTKQEKIAKSGQIERTLSRLLLVVENYPDLKASQNFLSLQAQLEGTENRISVARMRYNEAVKEFNTYIRTVFGSFFARRRGLTAALPYFKAETKAAKVPEVKF